MKMKKVLGLLLSVAMVSSFLTGCQNSGSGIQEESSTEGVYGSTEEEPEEVIAGNLTFAIWDDNLNAYIQENDMVGKFNAAYPDITVEVEKIKNDSEYWKVMEERASTNTLPDIMMNKAFTLSKYQSYLLDLSQTEAARNNELASGYRVGGKTLGIPMTAGYEYIYYWKDMFEEAGVSVPETWGEFVEAAKRLQEYYGTENQEFHAIACGLKDEFPDYPFMEFMPSLEAGNGQNWNTMARMDKPFTADTAVYKAYHKAYDIFTSGVFGTEPLEVDVNEAVTIFAEKNAAMTALGDWGLQNIQNSTSDTSELGTFYLPVRDTKEAPYHVIVQGDAFMGITASCETPRAARVFLEWFYSEAWYPDYINHVTGSSAMLTFPKEKSPILEEADELCPEAELVLYDGGGDDFTLLQNETGFDYKKLGVQMLEEGFDLDAALQELDRKWTIAREKLGME